jgi:hypothetical protein
MKTHNLFYLLAIIFAFSACGTAKYYQQTAENVNFNEYKTYAFLPPSDTSEFSVYNSGIVQEETVQNIKEQMNARGYELDAEDPDLLVLPHFLFERRTETVYDPVYPTYDYWFPGFYVNPWYVYYYPGYTAIPRIDGAGMREVNYTEGTIVIDIVENRDGHKLIWRGWSEDRINPNTFTREIDTYINQIFEKFPIDEINVLSTY